MVYSPVSEAEACQGVSAKARVVNFAKKKKKKKKKKKGPDIPGPH